MRYRFHIVFWVVLIGLSGISGLGQASVFDKPLEGNYAWYKDSVFKLKGNFTTSGVYFYERDLNGYNGNAEKWDEYEKKDIPTQTKEIEAFMYHEFKLKPSLHFHDSTINLHSEIEGGGYMWSSDYSSTVYSHAYDPPNNEYESTPIDMEKLKVTATFLEALTPIGLFLVGRLPNDIHGFFYALKFPVLPNWSFMTGYVKKNEGGYGLIDELGAFYSYEDTGYKDDYQDRDDLDLYIGAALFNNQKGFESKLMLVQGVGGSQSPKFTDLDVKNAMLFMDYNRNNWHMHFYFSYMKAMIAKLTKDQNPNGELLNLLIDNVSETIDMLDPERYQKPNVKLHDITVDPGITLGGNICYDVGKWTPEAGFLYVPGSNRWYKGNHKVPYDEDPPGNSSEKKILKDYLLNEIEDKYYLLTSTFGTLQICINGIDEFSFQNLKAIKAGGTFHITDKLDWFGQVLGAWRTDVSYFEKEYWDTFFLNYIYPRRLSSSGNDSNTDKTLSLPIILQQTGETYHQKVDPYIGTEFDTRLTWFVKEGLDISLIAAYFKMGGFYEDIMTPKNYTRQMVTYDAASGAIKSEGNLDILTGPYLGAEAHDPADAWTLQLKFEFRFQ